MALATPFTSTRGEDGRAVPTSIRRYWDQLSVSERQQILFLDEADLVKQLYKLNLSLLCVGLMQRHLRASNRAATDTTAASKKVAADTYVLLEAMEFMDIGTGFLTVKTELAEDTDRLFTLVGDVLAGFLTSTHVLTKSSFNKLFVTESETINTWADYQRLIAMLVEQLILRSYVIHLEKQAAQQMEQLLLESIDSIDLESTCQSNSSTAQTDEGTVEENEAFPADLGVSLKTSSTLNPNALAFQPQVHVVPVKGTGVRNPFAGKRALDECIVRVPWEDVESDADSAFDIGSVDGDMFNREAGDRGAQQWGRRKQRRRHQDAELEWQLQQVYASTSSLLGWDFSRQCELPDPCANLPWSDATLWRTAPKEVVRYFSPGSGDAYARFNAPHFLPSGSSPSPSRYYFNPGQPMPFSPPLLASGTETMPPHLHGSFGFQSAEIPMVLSPDFSNAQYQWGSSEDEVDI
ncbi:uncharacterized protein PITG_00217 [Phytophthora infestans T30-4]|uniref:Uncharacterized protein n=1 Tax=Phytophthora infestans (strain T30-4) TaxID=403677 RepID=D0MQ86_PHYIT|nr:uncharacterized protein PITG_00217 [Phytophthora infestans T30-4]EEY57655.1 conserved hypothetical protein [Phytophthora infestans T30-4]|eukprot:XP_002908841.1 conserved hypothetical protein [Phytophthora infestans T30-4]